MKKMIIFFQCILLFVPLFLFGADWFCYVNSNEISGLAMELDTLWLASTGGVVTWNITDSIYVKYSTVEGLADNIMKDVYVDGDGTKWFGTVEGVTKFDGANWTTYNTSNSDLPHNSIYAITQDIDGNYWFGTGLGCAKFDGVNWTAYTDLAGGVIDAAVRGIGVDTMGRIWTANNPNEFGDPGGVSMFDGANWTNWDLDISTWQDNYLLCIAVDGNNRVWAGTWLKWVYMYDGATWTHYDSTNSGLLGQQVEAIEIERDTILWFANHKGSGATNSNSGVSKYDGTNWTNYTPDNSGLDENQIFAIVIDTLNDIRYFGTRVTGVSSFDGSIWKNYKTSNEPHSNWITAIDVSNSNDVFFGTDHYGVIIYDGVEWSSYTSNNSGLGDNYVNTLYLDDGDTLWIGSQFSGIWKFDGITWTNYNASNSGLLGDIILSFDKNSNNLLWIGTSGWNGPGGQNGAVCSYDGSAWTNYYLSNSGLIDDDGLQVKVDIGDTLWVGTEEGVSKFDGNIWTDYTVSNSGLVNDWILSVAIDSTNNKWFGTRGGLSKFDGAVWQSWTVSNNLPSNEITGIAFDNAGRVWVSTDNGAAVFVDEEWFVYSQIDSLVDDNLTSVFVDFNGARWFGSKKSGIGTYVDSGSVISEDHNRFPQAINFLSIYPNPFSNLTSIRFQVPTLNQVQGKSQIILKIYDASGRVIRSFPIINLCNPNKSVVSVYWDGTDDNGCNVPAGIYFMQFINGDYVQTKKAILLR
jgi:ligand-binding sensor domain-containing protein